MDCLRRLTFAQSSSMATDGECRQCKQPGTYLPDALKQKSGSNPIT